LNWTYSFHCFDYPMPSLDRWSPRYWEWIILSTAACRTIKRTHLTRRAARISPLLIVLWRGTTETAGNGLQLILSNSEELGPDYVIVRRVCRSCVARLRPRQHKVEATKSQTCVHAPTKSGTRVEGEELQPLPPSIKRAPRCQALIRKA